MDRQPYGVRPLSISELLGQTAAIYRDHFETIIGVAAAILIPGTALQILLFAVIFTSDDLVAMFLLQIIAGVIGVAAAAAAMAAITSATAQIIVNGKTSILRAFDYAMPRITATMKASYLVYWILSFLIWTFIGIPIAIFLAIAWLVTLQVVVLEGTGARVALGRSWELTRNNRLRVLATTFAVALVTGIMMFMFLLPAVALMLRPVITDASSSPPLVAWILVGLFWIIGAVLITPLQYLAWTLVYFDLRARNDGLTTGPVDNQTAPQTPEPATIPTLTRF